MISPYIRIYYIEGGNGYISTLTQKLKLGKLEPVKTEEIKKSIQQLYVAMQIIEDKCTILEQIKADKAPQC